ncbi:ATP-binding protein, partial [Fusobacterium mortiferum]|uniref:ATP-binding protein n=1 Tax=Fusobacterium mortiferum TaxID=850 RepID=UPI000EBB11EC
VVESCDLLIIDDFGMEKSLEDKNSAWRGEKIYNLIDSRYRCEKPLIITTNLEFSKDESRCEIAKKFSMGGKNRIRDRIVEMCYPVEIKGKSRREIDEKKFFRLLEI